MRNSLYRSVSGTCDTRESWLLAFLGPSKHLKPYIFCAAVLKRDGTNVVTNSACASVSGNWVSPYDNVPTTLSSDLDIVRTDSIDQLFIIIIDCDQSPGPPRTLERGEQSSTKI